MSPGKFFWRKAILKLKTCLLDPIRNSKKEVPKGFKYNAIHAIYLYSKNK
jgi:hypothetical protein